MHPAVLIFGLVGAGYGLYQGEKFFDASARAAKWGAVAGGVYLAGKAMKAW